jgi:hypothetical protein
LDRFLFWLISLIRPVLIKWNSARWQYADTCERKPEKLMHRPNYLLVLGSLAFVYLAVGAVAYADDVAGANPVTESASPSDHLQPLAWMVGEWAGKSDDAAILVSAHWSDGGSSIVREFIVRSDGHETLSGTERIGWDAAAGKLKSWIFDSQGGTGEGYWQRSGDRWCMDSKETMTDGQRCSSSVVITPVDDQHFVWEVTAAKVSDAKLPAMRVEFKRAAEGK